MLGIGLVALTCFGVLGLTLGPTSLDFALLYSGGRGWLAGQDTYPIAIRLSPQDYPTHFSYPPQSAFILVPLAFLDLKTATVVWLFLNLASIAVIVVLTLQRIRTGAPPPTRAELLVIAALIVGNSFTTKTVWQGQTSLFVLAAILATWELLPRRWLAAGVCLAVAGFKPQGAVLFGLWLLLERQWRVLAVATVTTLLMSAYPFVTQGAVSTLRSWLTVLHWYSSEAPKAPGFRYAVTLQSLLRTLGTDMPSLAVVSIALTIVLWAYRNRILGDAVPSLLLGLSLTFISGYDQDYVWLIPLATTLWLRARTDPSRAALLGSLLVLVLVPLRLLRLFDLGALYPWRAVPVLVLMGLAIRWSWQTAASNDDLRPALGPA